MQLSVFTVCTPELTPEELILTAETAGIQGIEWRYAAVPSEASNEAPSFWRNNRCSIDPEQPEPLLAQIHSALNGQRIRSIALVPYLKCGDLDAAQQAFVTAQQLGAQIMRVGVPAYDRQHSHPYDVLQQEARRYLEAVQDLATQYQVKALIETHHGTIAPSASMAMRLVDGLNPNYIGVLYDPGNMVHEGYEHHRMGLEMLGPYLAHVHVKNAGWQQKNGRWQSSWAPLHDGIVSWAQMVQDLQSVGYKGYLGVEDFSGQLTSAEMLQHFAATFRVLLEQPDYEMEVYPS